MTFLNLKTMRKNGRGFVIYVTIEELGRDRKVALGEVQGTLHARG